MSKDAIMYHYHISRWDSDSARDKSKITLSFTPQFASRPPMLAGDRGEIARRLYPTGIYKAADAKVDYFTLEKDGAKYSPITVHVDMPMNVSLAKIEAKIRQVCAYLEDVTDKAIETAKIHRVLDCSGSVRV